MAANPKAARAADPKNVLLIDFNPIPKLVKLDRRFLRETFPIKSKKGIEGNATIKAGPANAKFNIPFSTLPAPIALRPLANSFKPDAIPLLDFPVAAPPLVAAVASFDISLGIKSPGFFAPAAAATLFDTILPVLISLNLPPPAILGSNLILFAPFPKFFIPPTKDFIPPKVPLIVFFRLLKPNFAMLNHIVILPKAHIPAKTTIIGFNNPNLSTKFITLVTIFANITAALIKGANILKIVSAAPANPSNISIMGPPAIFTNISFNCSTASLNCCCKVRASILSASSSFPSALNCSADLPIAS